MNYIKIQNDILKAKDKMNISEKRLFRYMRFPYTYGYYDNNVCIVDDGNAIYLIPDKLFYLDKDKIFNSVLSTSNVVEKMVKSELDTQSLIFTDTIRSLKNCKIDVAILKDDKNNEIAFDIKYLKNIGLKANECTFKGTNYKSPIYVYEYDKLVAIIMPVNLG